MYHYPHEADEIDKALTQSGQRLYSKLVSEGKLRTGDMTKLQKEMEDAASRIGLDIHRAKQAIEEMLDPANY